MDKKPEEMETQTLLLEIASAKRRDIRIGRITAVAVVALVAVLIVALVLVIPSLMRTLEEVRTTMDETQSFLLRANASLDTLDSMTQEISGVVQTGTENLTRAMDALSVIDFERLGEAVQKLSSLLESFAGFKLFG